MTSIVYSHITLTQIYSLDATAIPRGGLLSDDQKLEILVLQREGHKARYIANELGRSRGCIQGFLRSPSTYGTARRTSCVPATQQVREAQKRLAAPMMTRAHQKARVKWAKDAREWGRKFEDIIWSNEKKWNQDGPDGFSFYWADVTGRREHFSKRQNGGGSVMVWGGG
ncbi:hypothetical protein DYB37_013935 [Aphanomyces astaci]|uniref:Tc3 transposase DNA binding domain-containing protein n=1 Tax=Aphanomyces astaci TaxID=112090 RepID=A0A418EG48_APHAT|nr:hypothetical protein DYB37_013935 [Aphanomyces astaci]